jgi:uncharacterized peroxidase-related enzyme
MTTPEHQAPVKRDTPRPTKTANLSVVDEHSAPPEVARLYAQFRQDFGRPHVPGILNCFSTHPPLLEHMMGLAQSMLFADGALDRRHKEMLSAFVSAQNECAYCTDSHGYFFREHGGSAAALEAVVACRLESDAITPPQRALLNFARKVTENSRAIQPEDMEALRAARWSDLQIAETIHLTALFACFNRVVNAFGLPSQDLLAVYANEDKNHG